MAAIFNFNGSGRLARERNLYQGGQSTVKNKERGRGGGVKITESSHPSPTPNPTVYSNSKSNMAGQINDRELIMLARPNETPALQVSAVQKCAASFLLHLRKKNSTHNEKSFLPLNSTRMFSPACTCGTYYLAPLKPVSFCTSDNLVLFSVVLN